MDVKKGNYVRVFLVCMVLLGLCMGVANAATVTIQTAGSGNLADTYVQQDGAAANQNFGTSADLTVKDTSDSKNKRIYIMFNISEVPAGQAIDSASLCLYLNADNDKTVWVYAYHVFDTTWGGHSETTLTWNNQTCGTAFDNATACDLTPLSAVNSTGVHTWKCWDVTSAAQYEYELSNSKLSIALKTTETGLPSNGGDDKYNSKEDSNTTTRPVLNITYHSVAPVVTVASNAPAPGAIMAYSPVDFNFTAATNNASTSLDCILYVDGTNSGTSSATSAVQATISSPVTAGYHTWYVTCTDASMTSNTSATQNFTADLLAPEITLNSPIDNYLTNDSSVDFNFTATDDASTSMDCSVWVDGSSIDDDTATSGESYTFSGESVSEGQHAWNITCTDQGGHTGTSGTRYMTVDLTAPEITGLLPANFLMQNTTGVTFSYTPVDNFANPISCTLRADGGDLGSWMVPNNTLRSDVYYFNSGVHNWNITCTDAAGNSDTIARSFVINLPPIVSLNSPSDGDWIVSPDPVSIEFSFTAYDDGAIIPTDSRNSLSIAATAYCTAYLDGSSMYSAWVSNGSTELFNQTVGLGTHTWYVECDDNPPSDSQSVQSIGVSSTNTFTVSASARPNPSSSSGGGNKVFNLQASELSCPGDTVDVYAYTSSGGLAGVEVHVVLSDPYEGSVATGTTDSSGHVSFTLDSAGTYTFSATKSGYNNKQDSLLFALCEQPPQGNVTQPVTPPPTPKTHLACVNQACTVVQGSGDDTCSVNSDCATTAPPTQPPTNPDMQAADQAISGAQSAIADAQSGGKDVSGAMAKLAQAQAAFASGDYSQAKALADEAKQLALGAAAPPAPAPKPPASSATPSPAPTQSGGIPLLLLLLIGAVIVVVAGVGAYLMFGKKKKSYK